MKNRFNFLLFGMLMPSFIFSQPLQRREQYDIKKDTILYTVGYSHLDTEWNWDYPTTINTFIKNIMTENFHLFEKYPDYVFNFTGSRRYQMMKEYYPELYKKVTEYIHQGRWFVSGSSVDEGEVNVSSSESLIRQVLYGNNFFKNEFGTTSQDYMLPDCFGFIASVPSIWHHCGLLGFSTQKLTWHSAVGVPFNVGIWNGPDGKGVIAALNATNYTGDVVPRLDKDSAWQKRIEEDESKYGISFDYRYYGVGDEGGAPRERDVKNVIGSLKNSDSKIKILLTSSDQMYKDITPGIRQKLPVYTGDLLLIEHSAGSLTSQAFMKRMNRKNELLAKAAEELATMADWKQTAAYPKEKLNNSWNLVLGSQFHDILPGTSIPKAFEYAWNDEFIAANGFAETLKNSVGALCGELNTQGKGRSLVVYNPVALNREDVVTAEMHFDKMPGSIQVFDAKGKALQTQVIRRQVNTIKFIFLANIPSIGLAVFDVRETVKNEAAKSSLSVTNRTLENNFYKVTFDDNGDMQSIFDKKASKELLSKPARLEFLHEAPKEWPAWNMDWNDRQQPPAGFMDEATSIRIIEQGDVRVALEINRKGKNSEITQIVSLAAGEAGKRIEIANKVNWQSKGVSLKASFPLAVSNEKATYNLGVGTIQRSNNDSVKYEVPSHQWFDLTDKSGNYGVSILEDCKYGSDKPSDNELRLTLLYTPEANSSFKYQGTQDWGEHEFRYGIYGHTGGWEEGLSQWQGKFFNQPLLAFEVPQHNGDAGKQISFLSNPNTGVDVMAVKKMEDGDYFIVRTNELSGKDTKVASLEFPGNIEDAYEVTGQEQKIGPANFSNNKLVFDISHYTIKSFAVKLAKQKEVNKIEQLPVALPYNADVMSYDDNRDDGNFYRRNSIPAELMPDEITSEDTRFTIGSKADGDYNAVACNGQAIDLPPGEYNQLYILAAAGNDATGDFIIGNKSFSLKIQKWSGYVGQYYNREFALDGVTVSSVDPPFSKQENIAWFASHSHQAYPSANKAYQYSYLYKYTLDIPPGSKSITLPQNGDIKIIAITTSGATAKEAIPLQPLYDDFKDSEPVVLH
ncbi:MAG: glycoside hydrolase family 38 C-terminal domain-containing protein [Ginsengibacter sp.]